eukprot:684860-Pyramimonas_sp.AAC.1
MLTTRARKIRIPLPPAPISRKSHIPLPLAQQARMMHIPPPPPPWCQRLCQRQDYQMANMRSSRAK